MEIMETKVFLEDVMEYGDEVLYRFRVIGKHQVIHVKSFVDGIVTIRCIDDLSPTATTLAGLLEEESNFAEKLCEFLKEPKGKKIKVEKIKALHLIHPSWDGIIEVKKAT